MGARATYPIREGFFLDANTTVTGPYNGGPEPDAPINLGRIRTIRIIVLGATGVTPGNGEYIAVYLKRKSDGNGETVYFYGEDFDDNGVGIAHVRGGKLENEDGYTAYYEVSNSGGVACQGVYLDAVENIA